MNCDVDAVSFLMKKFNQNIEGKAALLDMMIDMSESSFYIIVCSCCLHED